MCNLHVPSWSIKFDWMLHFCGRQTSCQTGHMSVAGCCISWVPKHALSMASVECLLKGMHAMAIPWSLIGASSRDIDVCMWRQCLAGVAALELAYLNTQGSPYKFEHTIGKLSSSSLQRCVQNSIRAFFKPASTCQRCQLPGRKLMLATLGQGHLALSVNSRGSARVVTTPYVRQQEDLQGCVHARSGRLDVQMELRKCDAKATLPNWQVNCGYP